MAQWWASRWRIAVGLGALGGGIGLTACSGDEPSVSGTTTTATAVAEARSIESISAGRRGDEPGCAVGVGDDSGAATTAFGVADMDTGLPNDESTLFDLGSVSKQFTGGVILGLVEDDALTLDDTVRSWLPEVGGPAGDVALRHLLHHRSGIPDYTLLLLQGGLGFDTEATQADAIGSVAAAPLDFEPGSQFTYSNTNYVMLAEVAQRAAEQPFTELVRLGLFEPAGMATAIVSDYRSTSPTMATSYTPSPEFAAQRWRWTQVGDGAIHASITDMLSWGRYLLADVDAFIAEAEPAEHGKRYGAGVFVDEVGGQAVVSHHGSWQGFETYFAVIPDEELTVAVLCNRRDADPEGVGALALDAWRTSG